MKWSVVFLLLVRFLVVPAQASGENSGSLIKACMDDPDKADGIILEAAKRLAALVASGSFESPGQDLMLIFRNFSGELEKAYDQKRDIGSGEWRRFLEARWSQVMDCLVSGLRRSAEDAQERTGVLAATPEIYDFLIESGAFVYPAAIYGVSLPAGDHPLCLLLRALEEGFSSGSPGEETLLTLLEKDLFRLNRTIWGEEALSRSRKYFRDLLEQSFFRILDQAIASERFEEAQRWLFLCQKNGVRFLSPEEEALTGVHLPVTCRGLELILGWLKYARDQMQDLRYQESGSWDEHDVLEKMVCEVLRDDPFSPEQIQKAELIYRELKNSNAETKSRHLRNFCRTGQLKNSLLAMLGAGELKKLLEKGDGKELTEFFRYINGPDEIMEKTARYRGLHYLFHLGNEDKNNLLILAFRLKNPDFVELCYFLLRDGPYKFVNKDDQNQFHQLLLPVPPFENLSVSEEKKAWRIIRFLLYSGRIPADILVTLLKQKDFRGRTPLRLAADFGLYHCYSSIKKYLKEEDTFSNDEHAGDEDLQLVFLKGLLQRSEGVRDKSLSKSGKRIRDILKNYHPLRYLKDPDTEPEIMALETRLLSLAGQENPAQNKAEAMFGEVFKTFWESPEFTAFSRASVGVRMSWLKKPVQMIVRYILNQHANGNGDECSILSQMCGEKKYFLDRYLIRALRLLISEEINKIREKSDRMLTDEAFVAILKKYQN